MDDYCPGLDGHSPTTLPGGVSAASASIIIADPAVFSASPFSAAIWTYPTDSYLDPNLEIVTVTARSHNTLTVTRHVGGATAAHPAGAYIMQVPTPFDLEQIVAAIGAPGLPAGGTAGQVLTKIGTDDPLAEWETPAGGGGALADLTDVDVAGVTDGQALVYDDDSSLWVPVTIAAGGDVTGPAGAVAGNFPALDATGKILSDSGKNAGSFAPASAIALSAFANIATGTLLANNTGSPAAPAAVLAADVKTMLSLAKGDVGLGNVDNVQQMPLSYLDTDPTLAANSDAKIASQKATKAYADALIAANDALVYKGAIDCSGNPNYPAADAGHAYKVSVAGKIGGVSGLVVEAGDLLLCIHDGTASGDQATVGVYWDVIQVNLDGAVIGPASSTDGYVVLWNGATGKLVKNSAYNPASWLTAVTAHDVLSATHGDTTAGAVARGDLVTGQGETPKWAKLALSVPAAGLVNVLGAVNGDTEPGYKALFDATSPSTQAFGDSAAVGSAVVAARRDHKHQMMAAPTTVSGNAGTVTGATFTTALTVNTGTVTLTGNATNTSVLTIGADAVGVSGSNTGDQTLAGLGGQPVHANLTSLAGLTYAAAAFVKMTGAGAFTLDTATYLTSLSGAVLTDQTVGQTIGATGARLTKLWAVDLTVTNNIAANLTGDVTGNVSGSSASCSGNAATATKSTNLVGGNTTTLLGSMPYQSDVDTTTLLAPNTAATKMFLRQTGTGTNGAAPAWDTVLQADVGGLTTADIPVFSGVNAGGLLPAYAGTVIANVRIGVIGNAGTDLIARTYSDTLNTAVSMYRSRGTYAAPTATADGDLIGVVYGYATDASATPTFRLATQIRLVVDGAPTAGTAPGRLEFYSGTALLATLSATNLAVQHATTPTFALKRFDTSVTANDVIGNVDFVTMDTQMTTNTVAARIQVIAQATIATDINPGIMIFSTTPVGVAAALAESFRIDQLQNLVVADSKCLQLLSTPTDGTATGTITTIQVDTNAQGFGAPLRMAADLHLDTADANAAGGFPCIALAIDTGTGAGKKVLLQGFITNTAWNWTTGPGAAGLIYLSTDVGTMTQTAPSGVGDCIQVLGWAVNADTMYFCPSMNYLTHV